MQLQSQNLQVKAQIYLADNSKEGYAQELAQRYQFSVPIYIDRNPGTIYQSWNKGIRFAERSSVVIVNDDILIPEDFLLRINLALSDGCHVICPGSPGFPPVQGIRKGYHWTSEGLVQTYEKKILNEHSHLPLLTGWCFALSRECLDEMGYFDEQFQLWYGDTDMDYRIRLKYPITFIHELFVHHYGWVSSNKMDKGVFRKTNYEDQIRYEEKYGLKHQDFGWDEHVE